MRSISYTRLFSRTKHTPVLLPSSSSLANNNQFSTQLWSWCSLALGVLWLVPAIIILTLNFRHQSVGAGVGCLVAQSSPRCQVNLRGPVQTGNSQDLSKDDEQALAGLQVLAKALEAWFYFIAASLVYSVLKKLAGQDDKSLLPIGFIHVHTECGDLRILPKLFWGRILDSKKLTGKGWSRIKLYLFISLLAFICALCNLMGPATAILLIPNLRWISINEAHDTWFQNVLTKSRPLNASIARSCSEALLKAGNYSCTYRAYGSATDMMAAAAVATNDQSFTLNDEPYGNQAIDLPLTAMLLSPTMQETNLSFILSLSTASFLWSPSRQTLRELSADLSDYDIMTRTNDHNSSEYPDSALYNQTIQTRLQRRGPVLGQRNSCYRDLAAQLGIFQVGDNQEVRCYDQFNKQTWKCIPWGSAWKDILQANTSFSISDAYATSVTNSSIAVSIFSSSASLEMTHTTYESILRKERTFSWSTSFNVGNNAQRNLTGPQQMFEYRRIEPMQAVMKNGQTVNLTDFIFCDSQTMLGFADYVLDPSQVYNTIRLTEMNVITEKTSDVPPLQPIFMHPEWSLAAWSVDRSGAFNTVGGKRGACRKIIVAMENWVANGEFSQEAMNFRNIHSFVAAQTLSLIPYTTTTSNPKDNLHPFIWRKAMIQLWKYDIKPPSSKFSAIILFFRRYLCHS